MENQNQNETLIYFSDDNDIQDTSGNVNQNNNFYCEICKRAFEGNRGLAAHKRSAQHKKNEAENSEPIKRQRFKEFLDNNRFEIFYETIFDDFSYSEYTLLEQDKNKSFEQFSAILSTFMTIFKKSFKFQISCTAKYYKYNMFDEDNPYQFCELFHSSHQIVINGAATTSINEKVNEVQTFIQEKVREAELREPGCNFINYSNFKLHISRYNNNSGGLYVKLPFRSNNKARTLCVPLSMVKISSSCELVVVPCFAFSALLSLVCLAVTSIVINYYSLEVLSPLLFLPQQCKPLTH